MAGSQKSPAMPPYIIIVFNCTPIRLAKTSAIPMMVIKTWFI